MLCIGITSVILGVLLLTLVFCIPVDTMILHVAASVDSIFQDASEMSA